MSSAFKATHGQKTEGNVTQQASQIEISLLPNAAELQGYQAVNPVIVTTVLQLFKDEQAHRHSMTRDSFEYETKQETKLIDNGIKHSKLGQWLSYSITLLGVGAVYCCIFAKITEPVPYIIAGLIAGTPTILGLIRNKKQT